MGGAVLRSSDDPRAEHGATTWHVVAQGAHDFGLGGTSFMVDYRVDDLDAPLERLRAAGVTILDGPEAHDHCRFAWILDPEGNRVELWEPAG